MKHPLPLLPNDDGRQPKLPPGYDDISQSAHINLMVSPSQGIAWYFVPISRYYLVLAILSAVLSSCTSDITTAPVITICDMSDALEDCAADQTEFFVGQQLSARLIASEPFSTRQIIGKIHRLTDTDTIPLGTRIIQLQTEQRSVEQDLPFHEYGKQAAGTFLIEFVDETNEPIAKKEITIIDS